MILSRVKRAIWSLSRVISVFGANGICPFGNLGSVKASDDEAGVVIGRGPGAIPGARDPDAISSWSDRIRPPLPPLLPAPSSQMLAGTSRPSHHITSQTSNATHHTSYTICNPISLFIHYQIFQLYPRLIKANDSLSRALFPRYLTHTHTHTHTHIYTYR